MECADDEDGREERPCHFTKTTREDFHDEEDPGARLAGAPAPGACIERGRLRRRRWWWRAGQRGAHRRDRRHQRRQQPAARPASGRQGLPDRRQRHAGGGGFRRSRRPRRARARLGLRARPQAGLREELHGGGQPSAGHARGLRRAQGRRQRGRCGGGRSGRARPGRAAVQRPGRRCVHAALRREDEEGAGLRRARDGAGRGHGELPALHRRCERQDRAQALAAARERPLHRHAGRGAHARHRLQGPRQAAMEGPLRLRHHAGIGRLLDRWPHGRRGLHPRKPT
jgi:hypothetical protein